MKKISAHADRWSVSPRTDNRKKRPPVVEETAWADKVNEGKGEYGDIVHFLPAIIPRGSACRDEPRPALRDGNPAGGVLHPTVGRGCAGAPCSACFPVKPLKRGFNNYRHSFFKAASLRRVTASCHIAL